MKNQNWNILKSVWLLMFITNLSCKVDDNPNFKAQRFITPDASCVFLPTSLAPSNTTWDPVGPDLVLGMVLENTLGDFITEIGPEPIGQPYNTDGNDIVLSKIEYCFARKEGLSLNEGNDVLGCSGSSALKSVAVGALVEQETLFGMSFSSLNNIQLQEVYGTGFNLDQIPNALDIQFDQGTVGIFDDGDIFFRSGSLEDSTNSSRSVNWGNFPLAFSDTLIVQARGVGTKSGGKEIFTNWLTTEVEVCPGCAARSCGGAFEKICDLNCGTASPPCQSGFSGERFNPGSCLPFQGGDFTCEAFDECNP